MQIKYNLIYQHGKIGRFNVIFNWMTNAVKSSCFHNDAICKTKVLCEQVKSREMLTKKELQNNQIQFEIQFGNFIVDLKRQGLPVWYYDNMGVLTDDSG